MNNSGETTMIIAAQQGDRTALRQLLEQHYDFIFKVAFKWCGKQSDAEDIAQDCCIKLSRSLHTFNHTAKFSSWLYRMVINTSNDYFKQRKPNEAILLEHEDDAPLPDQQADVQKIWQKVKNLPDNLRDATLLVYMEGFTHIEAAEIMQCAEKTVSWYIAEAKTQLKQHFGHVDSEGKTND